MGVGETVVRGGWGQYRWNDQYNDYGGDLSTSQLMATYNAPSGQSADSCRKSSKLDGPTSAAAGASLPSSVSAADPNDYNVLEYQRPGISTSRSRQASLKSSLVEIAYVGNTTHHLLMGGAEQRRLRLVAQGSPTSIRFPLAASSNLIR